MGDAAKIVIHHEGEDAVAGTNLTGAEFEAAPAIRTLIASRGMEDQVFLLGKVPYASLRSLYRQASYVLSASLHESNCLPVLEAAASGSPIIVADIPPNRESAQVFQMRLFDPLDVESIAATLLEAWTNRHANRGAIESNQQTAHRFDWSAVADMYIDAATGLVSTFGKHRSGPGAAFQTKA